MFTYDFRAIQLSDRERMEKARQRAGILHSSYAFTTLYSWQQALGLRAHIENDFFIIDAGDAGYYFPCGDEGKAQAFLEQFSQNPLNKGLFFIPEFGRQMVLRAIPRAALRAEPDNFDYVASMSALAACEGAAYRNLRKEINRFSRRYALSAEPVTLQNLHVVRQIALTWNAQHAAGEACADTLMELKALSAFEQLGMLGTLIYANGNPLGMALATPASAEMLDVHFAKCVSQEQGADLCCKQLFCRMFADQYPLVNMEDDMGIPGLRTRKLLLKPLYQIPVYECSLGAENAN